MNLAEKPLCCVIWNDAHGKEAGEFTEEEIAEHFHDPAPIHTFGLLIKDDAKGVTIAQELTNPGDSKPTYRGLGFVPRDMVVKVILFGVPKEKKPKKLQPKQSLDTPLPFPLQTEAE